MSEILKVGLISDTHGFLDNSITEYFKDRDQIWHAGDVGNLQVLEELERFKPLKAVFGNIDGNEIRIRTKENQIIIHGSNTILLTHIAGKVGSYSSRVRSLIKEFKPNILICGHSHILKVINDKKFGLLHINPGAAGRHGFHKIRTLIRFELTPDTIQHLEVIELGPRSAKI